MLVQGEYPSTTLFKRHPDFLFHCRLSIGAWTLNRILSGYWLLEFVMVELLRSAYRSHIRQTITCRSDSSHDSSGDSSLYWVTISLMMISGSLPKSALSRLGTRSAAVKLRCCSKVKANLSNPLTRRAHRYLLYACCCPPHHGQPLSHISESSLSFSATRTS